MVRKPTFALLRLVTSNANPQPVDGVKRLLVAARRALMMLRSHEPVPKNWPPMEKEHEQHECIDAIRAALGKEGFIAYCRGNAMKYTWRDKQSNAEDYMKAAWYLEKAAQEQDK